MATETTAERDHWSTLARHRLGLHPTVAARRSLAATLRAVADDLDRLAGAEERQAARGNLDRPRGRGATAGDFIRLAEERVGAKTRLRLYIGRKLWYALGRPPRIDIQRVGAQVRLTAATGGAGYAISTGSGIPRVFVNQDLWEILRLNEGRYDATIAGDTIIVAAPRD